MMRPFLVTEVDDGPNVDLEERRAPRTAQGDRSQKTATAVETMMTETVAQGTSYKAFHDAKGKAFLPGMRSRARPARRTTRTR